MNWRSIFRDLWTLLMAMAAGSFLTQLRVVGDPVPLPGWALALMFFATATTAFARIHELRGASK